MTAGRGGGDDDNVDGDDDDIRSCCSDFVIRFSKHKVFSISFNFLFVFSSMLLFSICCCCCCFLLAVGSCCGYRRRIAGLAFVRVFGAGSGFGF